jgi:hypothetical protein
VLELKTGDRNIEVMRPYLDKAAETGRSQVAAIGVPKNPSGVVIAHKRDADPSRPPQVSFDKKDRRVTVYYFFLWTTPGYLANRRLVRPSGRITSERQRERGVSDKWISASGTTQSWFPYLHPRGSRSQ